MYTPKPNPILTTLTRALSRLGVFGYGKKSKDIVIGSQRPISDWRTYSGDKNTYGRSYDAEIPINGGLIRDPDRLRTLFELYCCPEIRTSVNTPVDDVFSSEHGDDIGLMLSDWVDKVDPETGVGKIAIDPYIKNILSEFIYRHLGAEDCKQIVRDMLITGDAFLEVIFDRQLNIKRTMRLPVGEMFRVEDNDANLIEFNQRNYYTNDHAIVFSPFQVVHFRYHRVKLYGQSLFESSISDFDDLQAGFTDLRKACHELGASPIHHELQPGSTREDVDRYRQAHVEFKSKYMVTDIYTQNGVSLEKISSGNNNDLKSLVDRIQLARKRIAMACRMPSYALGIDNTAKELSGQPATSYARHISAVRQAFSEGINQLLDTHLALMGVPESEWRYRISYPSIVVNPFSMSAPKKETVSSNDDQTV